MRFIETREMSGAPIKVGNGAEPYYATVDKEKNHEPRYATVDKERNSEPRYTTVDKERNSEPRYTTVDTNDPEHYYATVDKMNGRPLEEKKDEEETELN